MSEHAVRAISLEDLYNGFVLAKQADGVGERTIQCYQWMRDSLAVALPVDKLADVTTITAQDLQEWVVCMQGKYAAATRDQRISKAKTFFRWSHNNGFIPSDPSTGLKRPKKNWQPDPFSGQEVAMILDAARRGTQGIRNYAIVCFLYDSGIRNSELCSLEPGDVNVKTGQVKVRHGKGDKKRTILIGKLAKQALWKWMMVRPATAQYLFCTTNGKRFRQVVLTRIVRIIGDRVGIRAYPHRFRHTFALQYLKLGGDPYSLQALMGHEDFETVKEYVKLAAQDVREMYRSPLDALKA